MNIYEYIYQAPSLSTQVVLIQAGFFLIQDGSFLIRAGLWRIQDGFSLIQAGFFPGLLRIPKVPSLCINSYWWRYK